MESIIEHTHIRTNIFIQCFLPIQIRISKGVYQNTRAKIILHPVVKLVSINRFE